MFLLAFERLAELDGRTGVNMNDRRLLIYKVFRKYNYAEKIGIGGGRFISKYDVTKPHMCPVCGQHEFPHWNSYLVCPVCDWMDDGTQKEMPNWDGCANNISLNEYKNKYWSEKSEKGKAEKEKEIAALQKTADELNEKRNYKEELRVRRKIVAKTIDLYGDDSLEKYDALNYLAFTYHDLYWYDAALSIRKDTLRQCKNNFGEDHEATATAMAYMAYTLNEMGRYREGLAYDYEAYISRLSLLGTNNLDTITTTGNLSASYADIGDYKTALFYIKKAQEYISEIYDEADDDIVLKDLDITVAIAILQDDLENYDEALELFEKVEKAYEERFGFDNEKTLEVIRRISLTLSHKGEFNYKKAKSNLKTLLAMEKSFLGEDHRETLWTMTGLACVLEKLGEYEESKTLRKAVLNVYKEHYKETHPVYIHALNGWAYSCYLTKDTEQEKICATQLCKVLKDELIESARDLIDIQDTLILLYTDLGEYEKATKLAVKMIKAAEYHYYYKREFLKSEYDTAKLAFEKAGNPEVAKEFDYKKNHMDRLIYSDKPMCGMKLKAKADEEGDLTPGKIYELLGTERVLKTENYSIIDDEEFGPYLYSPEQFDVVDDYGNIITNPDRMRYCPYFEKEITEGDCWEVVHCGRGWIKKSFRPDVKDWDKAIKLCNICLHRFE